MASVKGKMGFKEAAYEVLKSSKKPLKPHEVVEIALEKGFIKTHSKRPAATMSGRLWSNQELFVSVGDGKWTIRKD